MTTPTPAQQLEEVSCRMKRIVAAASQLRERFGDGPHCEFLAEISGQAALADEAIPRTLAALEAVEGASRGIVRERGGSLAAIHYVIGMLPPDAAFPALGDNVLIIPADAVEVGRGE